MRGWQFCTRLLCIQPPVGGKRGTWWLHCCWQLVMLAAVTNMASVLVTTLLPTCRPRLCAMLHR
jgi:hypothetical protein